MNSQKKNVLNVIYPYCYNGMWVFDDEQVGLNREPFVGGADVIIEYALKAKGIENPESGFQLMFSGVPFPDYDFTLTWVRGDNGGNYYWIDAFQMEGWLCPALFRYFESAPQNIYVQFKAKGHITN